MVNQVNSSQVTAEVVQTGPGTTRASTAFAEVVQSGPGGPSRASTVFSEVVQTGPGTTRASTVFIEVVRSFVAPISGYASVALVKDAQKL